MSRIQGFGLDLKPVVEKLCDTSLSKNTLLVYTSGMKSFGQYLTAKGAVDAQEITPEISDDILIQFIAYCSQILNIKYSTIKLYLCGIRYHYLRHGRSSPLESSWTSARVYTFLNSVKRNQTNTKRERMPIDINVLKKIVNQVSKSYTDKLMTAACTLAFFAFLRCGEFTVDSELPEEVILCKEDLVISSNKLLINLRKSKTDPFRKGIAIHVYSTKNEVCPVAAMHQYMCSAKQSASKALFIMEDGNPLNRKTCIRDLKLIIHQVGLDDSKFNGHSLRIGAATTCSAIRMEDHLIKTLGRWSSDCYTSYIHTNQTTVRDAHIAMSK